MSVIEAKEISKQYDDVTALKKVDFVINKGEFFGLLGPNGAGKTTLLKILTGQIRMTSGKAKILGMNIEDNVIDVKKKIAIVPEQESPPSFLTPREVLEMVASIRQIENPDIEESTFLRFSFLTRDLAKNNSTHINLDFFNLSEEINGWNADLTLSKHIGIIPEFIYLTPGIGFGFASCRQEIDSDFLDYLGDNEGNKLRSTSWYVSAKIGARILIRNLILFADLGYNNMNFDDWDYEYKEDSSTDEYVTSEWNDIDNEFVPYPELKMPLSIDIGFAFEF